MKKVLILSLLLTIVIFSSFQLLNKKNKNNLNLNKYQINQDSGFISDLIELKWVIPFTHKGRTTTLIGDVLYPPLKEYQNRGYNAKTGRPVYFNLIKNQKTFKRNKTDSIIVFDSPDRITLVNLYTGKILYRKERKSYFPIFQKTHSINDSLLFTVNNDTLLAYDLKRTITLWRFKTKSAIFDDVKKYKNTLIVSDKTNLYALSRASGKILWQMPLGEFYSSPIIENDKLFVVIKNKGISCVNLEEQKIEWIYKDIVDYRSPQLQFILNDNTLFYYSGKLYAINKATGKLNWNNEKLDTESLVSFVIIQDYIVTYYYSVDYNSPEYRYNRNVVVCDKNTGKIIYKESPVSKNKTDYTFKNNIFKFVDKVYENNFYAYTSDSLYCFEILK